MVAVIIYSHMYLIINWIYMSCLRTGRVALLVHIFYKACDLNIYLPHLKILLRADLYVCKYINKQLYICIQIPFPVACSCFFKVFSSSSKVAIVALSNDTANNKHGTHLRGSWTQLRKGTARVLYMHILVHTLLWFPLHTFSWPWIIVIGYCYHFSHDLILWSITETTIMGLYISAFL